MLQRNPDESHSGSGSDLYVDPRASFLDTLLDHSRTGLLFEAADRSIMILNQGLARILGLEDAPEDFVGRDGAEFLARAQASFEDPARFLARTDETVRNGEVVIGDRFRLKESRAIERDYMPVLGPDGSLLGHGWQYRDVTNVSRTKRALREAEGQLRHSQKLEVVGRLAAGVAHDFNNLLMAIIGNGEVLLERVGAQEPYRENIEEILNVAERTRALTRHLVAFTRKQSLEPAAVDPNQLLGQLDTVLRWLIRENIGIVYALQPQVGCIEVDPGQFEQLLLSLAVNAAEAMPDGGKLVFETADVELDDEYSTLHVGVEAGSYVRLSVSDTGCGMDDETRKQVFEPLFATEESERSGLGMSTVYGIVKQSGGNIWVYSEPGLGTTFKVYLPRVSKPVEFATPDREPVEPPDARATILVVEDEDAVRLLVRRALLRQGFAVLDAKHPYDALRISAEHDGPIDLLLTDVVMPQMNGGELARRVLVMHREAKTLFMSGYPAEAVASHGVLDPGVPLLEKPISPNQVASKIRDLLGGKQLCPASPRRSSRDSNHPRSD